MSAASEPSEVRGLPRVARFGWGLYQQVAAILAAFGLIALIGHFWEIGWRGFLMNAVGVWDVTVRPAMAWVFHTLVSVPLHWVGVEFEIPLWWRDYLSVGIVILLSLVRAQGWDDTLADLRDPSALLVVSPIVVLLWPIAVPGAIYYNFSFRPAKITIFLSPILYLGLMLAVNYWLLSDTS